MFLQNLSSDKIKEVQKRYELSSNERQFGSIDQFNLLQRRIVDFVKQHHRIMYGGFALDLVLKGKIYSKDDRPDLEFYSPQIYTDGIKLANHLKQYYKEVELSEALHQGTIKLYIDYQQICDITFLESQIESFFINQFIININGLYCLSPEIMLMDKFRMISNPTSFNRVDKELKRLKIMFDNGVTMNTLLKSPTISKSKSQSKQQSNQLHLIPQTHSQSHQPFVIPKILHLGIKRIADRTTRKEYVPQNRNEDMFGYLREQLVQNKEVGNDIVFCDGASLKALFPNFGIRENGGYGLIISTNIDRIFNYVILLLKSKGVKRLRQLQFGKFQEFFDRMMILGFDNPNEESHKTDSENVGKHKLYLLQPPHNQCFNYFDAELRIGNGDRQIVLSNYHVATAETQLAIKTQALLYFKFRMFNTNDDMGDEIQDFASEVVFLLEKAGEKNSFSSKFIGDVLNIKLERKIKQQRAKISGTIPPFEYNPDRFNQNLIDKYANYVPERKIGDLLTFDTIYL